MPQGTVTHLELNSKPSKSARKREQHALQALGERLIELDQDQLTAIGLDERLFDAVVAAKSMRAHGALRRQKQLIGKLMRQVDPAPIRTAIDQAGTRARLEKKAFREAEKWRDRIIDGDTGEVDAFSEFLGYASEPVAEAAAAQRSASSDRTLKESSRRLFREIHREIILRMQNEADSI